MTLTAGATVVMSGATSGIGAVAAERLAARGARIVFIARDAARASILLERLHRANPDANHVSHLADLAQIAAMKDVAARIRATEPVIDVLIANAGAVFMGHRRTLDGLAPTFALNHLAYHVTTLMLLDCVRAARAGRIVCTASSAHRYGRMNFSDLQRDGIRGYAQSKLANLLFVGELARRLAAEHNVMTVNAFHPGFVATRFADETPLLWRTLMRWRKKASGLSPEQGASTLIWLATSPDVAAISGGYFADCQRTEPASHALDTVAARQLWDLSVAMTGVDMQPAAAQR